MGGLKKHASFTVVGDGDDGNAISYHIYLFFIFHYIYVMHLQACIIWARSCLPVFLFLPTHLSHIQSVKKVWNKTVVNKTKEY